jgi:hypothetical protein
MRDQSGASLLFIGVFASLQGQMVLNMALTMVLVFVGTLITCMHLPTTGPSTGLVEDLDRVWAYVAGIGAVMASALCQSGRLAYQELLFGTHQHRHITALQLATLTSLLSSALLVLVLGVAQVLPGFDHGVQVTTAETARLTNSVSSQAAAFPAFQII